MATRPMSAWEQPEIAVLTNQATLVIALMVQQMSAFMDEEGRLPATPVRRELFRLMKEFREPLRLAGEQMRAYLLTGDPEVKKSLELHTSRAKAGFLCLSSRCHLMTATQLVAWNKVGAAWTQFEPLPDKLFVIRESDDWNIVKKIMRQRVCLDLLTSNPR